LKFQQRAVNQFCKGINQEKEKTSKKLFFALRSPTKALIK